MKTNRLQYQYRKSASKLHKKVGNLLRSGKTFAGYHEVYQEYPVNRVNTSYPNSSHHFDWVVPHLKVVIECHGEQHYKPTSFGGNQEHNVVIENFKELKYRDKVKKNAALEAGFIYIEIPYTILLAINALWLQDAYNIGQIELEAYNKETKENDFQEEDRMAKKLAIQREAKHKERLRIARERRKEYYRVLKKRKKEQDGI